MSKFSFGANDVVNATPLSELVAKQVARLDKVCQIKVLAGFTHVVRDAEYHFSYKLTDQANFSNMTNFANTSLQLGELAAKIRVEQYGDNLPAPLPSEWSCQWNGHTEDGESVVLTLNLTEFLELSSAAIRHNQSTLAEFRKNKADLESSTSETELLQKQKALGIDKQEFEASELMFKYNVQLTPSA